MDDVDLWVRQRGFEVGVRRGQAQARSRRLSQFRTGVDDTADVHAEPAQSLDMHGPDEAAADDGGTDVTEAFHCPSSSGNEAI